MQSLEALPPHLRLDTHIAERFDTIVEHTEAEYEKLDDSFIDFEVECRIGARYLELTDILSVAFRSAANTGEYTREAKTNIDRETSAEYPDRLAAYNAFFFALTTTEYALDGKQRARYGQVPGVTIEQMESVANEYLERRDNIARLIGRFIHQIDPSEQARHTARGVAALTFAGIEHTMAQDFIKSDLLTMNAQIAAAGDSLYARLADPDFDK